MIYPFLLFLIAIKFCSATGMAWIEQIFLLQKQIYRELGLGVALEIFKAQVQVKVPGQVQKILVKAQVLGPPGIYIKFGTTTYHQTSFLGL